MEDLTGTLQGRHFPLGDAELEGALAGDRSGVRLDMALLSVEVLLRALSYTIRANECSDVIRRHRTTEQSSLKLILRSHHIRHVARTSQQKSRCSFRVGPTVAGICCICLRFS